jgi:hypothetical protein
MVERVGREHRERVGEALATAQGEELVASVGPDAARMTEEVAHGQGGERRRQVGNIGSDRHVEAHPALLGQLQHRRCGDRLGDRGEPPDRLGRRRGQTLEVREPMALEVGDLAAADDRDRGARRAGVGEVAGDRRVDPGDLVGREHGLSGRPALRGRGWSGRQAQGDPDRAQPADHGAGGNCGPSWSSIGQAASRALTSDSSTEIGQSICSAGSFQRRPRSCSGA